MALKFWGSLQLCCAWPLKSLERFSSMLLWLCWSHFSWLLSEYLSVWHLGLVPARRVRPHTLGWCVQLTAWMASLTPVVGLDMALSPSWAELVFPSWSFTSSHGLGQSVLSDWVKCDRYCFEKMVIILQDVTPSYTGSGPRACSKSQHSPGPSMRLMLLCHCQLLSLQLCCFTWNSILAAPEPWCHDANPC